MSNYYAKHELSDTSKVMIRYQSKLHQICIIFVQISGQNHVTCCAIFGDLPKYALFPLCHAIMQIYAIIMKTEVLCEWLSKPFISEIYKYPHSINAVTSCPPCPPASTVSSLT